MTEDELDYALDRRFAKLDERLAARIQALVERFGTLGDSLDRVAASTVEAARLGEAGPTERLRQNLAGMCFQTRLRATCERGAGFTHRELAILAVADADALLAALAVRT